METAESCELNLSEAELFARTLHASVPEQLTDTEVGGLSPDNYEQIRMRRLRDLELLNTPEAEGYDRVTRMAARLFGMPIAAVSLTDADRQWFKSYVGCPNREIPRLGAPCAAVTSLARPVVINDMSAHEAFRSCVLVEAGLKFYAGVPLTTRDGHIPGAFCVIDEQSRKISEEQVELLKDFAAMIMAQIELEHDFGRRDPVSGLPNRNQLAEDLADLKRQRPQDLHSLIAIDLADPPRLSHTVGVLGTEYLDSLLRNATVSVMDILGSTSGVYCVGPASLAMLRPGSSGRSCAQLLTGLRAVLSQPLLFRGIPVTVEPRIGVSTFRLEDLPVAEVLRTGLSAVEDARRKQAQISYYSRESDEVSRRRLMVLTRVQDALYATDQFRLVYQPRVEVRSGTCVGAEALLRWTSPELGNVGPGEFIPLVEETALVNDVTEWVLGQSITQIAAWLRTGVDACVSMNVSARNLANDSFVASVAAALSRTAIPPSALELEFTESALIDDPARVVANLNELRAMGLKLAIDDFGTGYSSLSYLQRLPVDVIKIDRSFLCGAEGAEVDRRLVHSILGMARDLGFTTVAEGVETRSAYEFVADAGCDQVQGYYVSKPLPPGEFESWLSRAV